MGGSTYSRRRRKVKPSERNRDVVNAADYFIGTVNDASPWNVEKLKHLFDIKYIPLDKLYSTKRKIPMRDIEREQDTFDKMSDYEPINVIKRDKQYIVISGHERVIAMYAKGYKKIKARVYDVNKMT